ncbi:MAG: hypothetical protein DRQ55_05775 [Planctomycetota bacterium]|nr:MAG: hypothetical protein DRQ55_05775 [Planctomycetota bacterium]
MPDPLLTAGAPAALGLLLLGLAAWWQRRRTSEPCAPARAALALGALALALSAAELACWGLAVQSDNVNRTLSSQRWFERHWRPINELGFRDRDHVGALDGIERLIFFVGDSFTAGQGVDDVEQRFPDLVGAARGPGSAAVIVAQCGWNTSNQREAIDGMAAQLGRSPDEVVLAYVPNDILNPSYLAGREQPFALPADPTAGSSSALSWMAGSSYLTDALWWRVLRRRALSTLASEHGDALQRAHADAQIWQRHRADLLALAERTRAHGAALTVLVFPDLAAVPATRALSAKVAALFKQAGAARVIDLGPLLAGRPVEQLVTSPRDGHPGAALHAEVAALLLAED